MATTDVKPEQKKVSRIKVKKKLWYSILAPKVFSEKEVGESYLASAESALGRVVKINLRDLTGNVKDQSAYLSFKIEKVQGTQLHTSLMGYELMPSHVKRMVRKNVDRLDDYYELVTKDGDQFVLKSLMMTISQTHRSIRAVIRKQLGELLAEEAGKVDFDTFVSNIVGYKLQFAAKKKLSKIYPLREVAVRYLRLTGKTGVKAEVKADVAAEKTA